MLTISLEINSRDNLIKNTQYYSPEKKRGWEALSRKINFERPCRGKKLIRKGFLGKNIISKIPTTQIYNGRPLKINFWLIFLTAKVKFCGILSSWWCRGETNPLFYGLYFRTPLNKFINNSTSYFSFLVVIGVLSQLSKKKMDHRGPPETGMWDLTHFLPWQTLSHGCTLF